MIYFPLVGAFLAVVSLSVFYFIEPFTSLRFAGLLLVLFPIILSGGLHVDGLADSFDGFFHGKDRNDILAVMKDSRIGVWGTLSVIFLILLKWELIMVLPSKGLSFILALSAARWSQVFLSYLLPYARNERGLGSQVAGLVKKKEILLSTMFVVLISLTLGLMGCLILAIISAFIYLLSLFYKHKLEGITGDVIGATSEITETVVLLLAVVIPRLGVYKIS